MQKPLLLITLLSLCSLLSAQDTLREVLLPLHVDRQHPAKSAAPHTLPFFDDFANPQHSASQWQLDGALINNGYAPLPPTLGMVTLDAYNSQGVLYPTIQGALYPADTLTSACIRLDSVFSPYARALTIADSLYLSFFYLPGGGYGNRWEGSGDRPESSDSLMLEFFNPRLNAWQQVWSIPGISADTLFARTGSYWQFVQVAITNPDYIASQFQFRFRNYCSLDNDPKRGILSNADQWNIDYIYLHHSRSRGDSTLRDVAFVNPATSLLSHFSAMPACQYTPADMRQQLPLTITNRFSQELAVNYSYTISTADGTPLHTYEGGFENAPVFWQNYGYQTSPAHAEPRLDFAFPYMTSPRQYTITHVLREGVSGDGFPHNDTLRYTQNFDNYYAYDDGTAENGYGITSTSSIVRLACSFTLNVEDTLTAIDLYFNRTFNDQNADLRFYITVWDDAGGHPGNIIYRDHVRRQPRFAGLNTFVRYLLEEPILCSGTIYVGFEQTTHDFINLGFDRNNDASQHIHYLTSSGWQTSILRGALMLRPYFGQQATVAINPIPESQETVTRQLSSIVIDSPVPAAVSVFDQMGRKIFSGHGTHLITPSLPCGMYFVSVGNQKPQKIIIL